MFPRQNKAIKSLMDSKSKTSRRTSQRDIIFVDKEEEEEEEEEDEENAIIRLLNPRKLSASHI
jgi:hypothetical protein